MTPPRMPGHESDEIVDMTPVFSPEKGEQDIVDMTPTETREADRREVREVREVQDEDEQDLAGMTPMYLPESGPEELEDMFPVDIPEDEPPAVAQRTPAYTQKSRTAKSRLGGPPYVSEPAPEEPPTKRSKGGSSRWKRVLLVVAALVAIAIIGRSLGQSIGRGVGSLTGGNQASQATAPAASTPTPKPVQIGNGTSPSTPGALILLNPGVVRQGTSVGVGGSGFDPGAVIDLTITRQGSGTTLSSTFVQADKNGTFYNATLGVPMSLSAGNFIVQAKERNGHTTAQAVGTVAGGAPQVKLGTEVGKPGDVIVLALHGFAPGETVNVYWNTLSGQPVTTFKADGGGSIGQGKIQVPFGAVGYNTFLFVGANSQSLVAANFLVLQLYPTVKLGSYALKAANVMTFSGTGFGPGERVFVFLNSTQSQPLAVITTDATGAFKNAPGFVVPFTIKGKQTLIFMGEQSRAPDAVNFTVLPYSPVVEPSTYGGFPGTTITFYASGFASNEVVHLYAGHSKSAMGNMVACFQTDGKGNAAAVGSYTIPGDAQGQLGFALVGAKSGGVGVASVNVTPPPVPVHTPPQPAFTCPLDPPPSAQPTNPNNPQQPQANPNSQPNAPQGKLGQPGQHTALQAAVAMWVAPHHAGGALAVVAAPSRPDGHVSASQARAGMTRLSVERARGTGWSILGQARIPPLMVGLGFVWLFLVLVLNLTLILRSAREVAAEDEDAEHEDAATGKQSPALVVTSSVASEEGKQTIAMASGVRPAGASSFLESRQELPPGPAPPLPQRHVVGPGSSAALPAGRRSAEPTIRAARCTATWHGGGDQPGHDATFAQCDVRLAAEDATCGVFLVADGRCGAGTDVSPSQFAVEHIARRVITVLSSGTGVPPNLVRPLFKYAVMQAGDTLLTRNATHHTDATTTVTGALVVGERAYIVNVGNSRTYLFSPSDGLWQITRDHSVVYGMVSAGLLDATAIDESPRAQHLYRCLGDGNQPVRVDTFALSIVAGDQLLLCSDGLWREVRESRIEAILGRNADPREATWELVHAASEGGSEDDISAIVVHVLGVARHDRHLRG
jgi:serine/threonine protein phosphatase PrpC